MRAGRIGARSMRSLRDELVGLVGLGDIGSTRRESVAVIVVSAVGHFLHPN
jgi:phosphoglycerate dehydrogenase-like enzyme